MKKYIVWLALGLGACSSLPSVFDGKQFQSITAEQANVQLQSAAICCKAWIDAPTIDITQNSYEDYLFDNSAPAFNFPTGKSFFRVFRLPLNSTTLMIEFDAPIKRSVFVPTIDFYNQQMQLVKRIEPNQLRYKAGASIMGDILTGRIMVNNLTAGEGREFAYMVVYTTDESAKGQTQVVAMAKQFAKANNTVPPDIPDPWIPHAAAGVVSIKFSLDGANASLLDALDGPLLGGSDQNSSIVDGNQSEILLAKPQGGSTSQTVNTSSGSLQTQPVVAPAANATMLPETEQMYNQMILQAVQAGDIGKAMTLAAEAERAGSASAKNTFIQAVKQSQH